MRDHPTKKIYIVRSLVATREIGFLPGDHEDKSDIYQIPYKNMVKYMFALTETDFEMLYGNLKTQKALLVSGVHHSSGVQLLIKQLLLLMNIRT